MTKVFDITERLQELDKERHKKSVRQELTTAVEGGDAQSWTPAAAINLVQKLIESGEINPEIIIVPYLEKKTDNEEDGYVLSYFTAGGTRADIVTLMETLKLGIILQEG